MPTERTSLEYKHSVVQPLPVDKYSVKDTKICSHPEPKIYDHQESKPKVEPKISPPKQESSKSESRSKDKYDEKRYHQKLHEEKAMYDAQPKMHMDESFLANTMATENYMTQAQYHWQWERLWGNRYYDNKRDFQGYPHPMLHQFPPLEMLPKQPTCEKEKPVSKSHRYSSSQSSSSSSSKMKETSRSEREKHSSLKKEDKKSKHEQELCSASSKGGLEDHIKASSCSYGQSIPKHSVSVPNVSERSEKSKERKDQKLEETTTQQPLQQPMKQAQSVPSGAEVPSMGVYTPDSTTNSVHSLHYGHCEMDVTQLNLESPASITSDVNSQNSVEIVRPPPPVVQNAAPQPNYDCSVQHTLQQNLQNTAIAATR